MCSLVPAEYAYTDFGTFLELAARQQQLGVMLSRLTKLAEEFNVAVLYSNHVQSDPGMLSSASFGRGSLRVSCAGDQVHRLCLREQATRSRSEVMCLRMPAVSFSN